MRLVHERERSEDEKQIRQESEMKENMVKVMIRVGGDNQVTSGLTMFLTWFPGTFCSSGTCVQCHVFRRCRTE